MKTSIINGSKVSVAIQFDTLLDAGLFKSLPDIPQLEDQNPLRRSEVFAGTRSATLTLTEAIKILSNVSGSEADVANITIYY